MRIYDWIVIIGFVILFGWCVIVNNKYSTLQEDYNILKVDKENVIDSLNKENNRINSEVLSLEDSICKINDMLEISSNKIESIKKEEFTVSTSFSKSAKLLKDNLTCTDL